MNASGVKEQASPSGFRARVWGTQQDPDSITGPKAAAVFGSSTHSWYFWWKYISVPLQQRLRGEWGEGLSDRMDWRVRTALEVESKVGGDGKAQPDTDSRSAWPSGTWWGEERLELGRNSVFWQISTDAPPVLASTEAYGLFVFFFSVSRAQTPPMAQVYRWVGG